MPASRVTLVTGFPNFRATHFVGHLLANQSDDVWAVVSAADATDAERYRAGLPPDQSARLRFFSGDAAAIDMGLSGKEYRELCSAVGCIQHLAQIGAGAGGRKSCEAVNIGGMREVLELARAAARLESLVVHSSLAVSGDRQGDVTEAELELGQRFPGPESFTLARAELMARRRSDRLPIVVLRTGQVVGPSTNGRVDTLDGVYLLILLILGSPQDLSPLLPDWGDAPLHVVPIDHLVRAADAVSRSRAALGATLQLTDPNPMTVRVSFNRCMKIRERLSAEGLCMPPVGAALRRDTLLRDGLQSILWRPRTFINMTFRKVRYGTEVAERLLRDAGLVCPSLESYFEHLVRHVAQTLANPPPKVAKS